MGYAQAGFGGGAVTHLLRYEQAVGKGDTALAALLEQQAYAHTQQNIKDRATWQGIYSAIEARKPKSVAAPTPPSPATVTVTTGVPAQPIQPIQPILVAGPAPSPSGGGGGGGGGDLGLAPAAGGTGLGALVQQPVVLIGLLVLGFFALRRGGGTRKF